MTDEELREKLKAATPTPWPLHLAMDMDDRRLAHAAVNELPRLPDRLKEAEAENERLNAGWQDANRRALEANLSAEAQLAALKTPASFERAWEGFYARLRVVDAYEPTQEELKSFLKSALDAITREEN